MTDSLLTRSARIRAVKESAYFRMYRDDLTHSENRDRWNAACEAFDEQGGSYENMDSAIRRIVELARSLNYTVNVSAQNLRLRQNTTVAVIVPSFPNLQQRLTEPFFISLISAIANALTDRGFEMLPHEHELMLNL